MLDRFMRVAHRCRAGAATVRRGNHTFVNALPWMCRAEAPWRGLPAVGLALRGAGDVVSARPRARLLCFVKLL